MMHVVVNGMACLGYNKGNDKYRNKMSKLAMDKFEKDTKAQDFRNAIHPLSIANLYNPEAVLYILKRFHAVHITARPGQLIRAYRGALTARLLYPDTVWNSDRMPDMIKRFYSRLATRPLPLPPGRTSAMHKDVCNILGNEFGIKHRSLFQWGPFMIDIGIDPSEIEQHDDDNDKLPTFPGINRDGDNKMYTIFKRDIYIVC